MSIGRIKDIENKYYRIPLLEPLGDSMHGVHTCFELVVSIVTLEDGESGVGYTYTGGVGGRATWMMLEYDLKPALLGLDATNIEDIWELMQRKVHYVARGGIASFAISAIDIALWDIRCKKAEQPLYKYLGGVDNKVKSYYGGIDLHFSMERLLSNIQQQLDSGHNAIKIKLGQDELSEDIARIKAVRELLGPDKDFMVDANMIWSVDTAIKAGKLMKPYNIYWFEEPTLPDDYEGYGTIADSIDIPIAMGENLHTIFEHEYAMKYGKIKNPQPDASNIGGITGWLKVAKLAEKYDLPICTHGMQELHVSLMAAMPHADYMEIHSFPIDQYTHRPVVVNDGIATPPEIIGSGVRFDWDKLYEYEIKI